MTPKSPTEGKNLSASVKKRAKAATVSSPAAATRKVKAGPEILTEDARYELARKEAEARSLRHNLRDRLQGRP